MSLTTLQNIIEGKKIDCLIMVITSEIFHVDDVINGIVLILDKPSNKKFIQLFNIGNSKTKKLKSYLNEIE